MATMTEIERTRNIHLVWAEREKAIAMGVKIRKLMGKWQYVYKSERGRVSLIQTIPGFGKKMVWELLLLKKGESPERFRTKKEAELRVIELLG